MSSALSIAPSQQFEGNDGSWSTFNVNVGTAPQKQRVLPATSQSFVAVVRREGCINVPISNCDTARGGPPLFNYSQDLTFSRQSAPDGQTNFFLPFDSEGSLGIAQVPTTVGLDTISIDTNVSTTPNLTSQVVAAYNAVNPWLGMLGVRGNPNHILGPNAPQQESPLRALKSAGSIPSVYFGYTAGKSYKSPPVFGSLTFGGYDAARVDMSSALSVSISDDTTNDLSVLVNSITINNAPGTASTTRISVGTTALIDSVVPELWLPSSICDQLENALGLVFDRPTQMYLMNDTQRTNLQPASFTFFLSSPQDPSASKTISIPYAAFDLIAKYPLAGINGTTGKTSQRYFPLRRSNSTQGSFLGRAFLQEAYITADYDKKVMTIGPVRPDAVNGVQNIVTIRGSSSSSGGGAPLSSGAIAGIAIGAIAGIALVGALIFVFWRRRRQAFLAGNTKKRPRYHQTPSSVGDTTLAADSEFGNVEEQRRHVMGEYFKPGNEFGPPPVVGSPPGDDQFLKSELDATHTSVSAFHASQQQQQQRLPSRNGGPQVPATEMHELDGGTAAFRPQTHRSPISWGSAVSAISPMNHNPEEHFQTLAQLHEHPSPDLNLGTSPPLVSPNDRHLSSDSVPPLRIPHERQLSSDSVPRPLRVRHTSADSVPGLHEMQ